MTTVADIVLAKPAAARVFERHEIDYCCHGQRPLEQACSEAGVDLDAVQAELDALAVAPLTGPVADEVGALIGHIVSVHHTYLRRELPRLGELMVKVIAAHGTAHPEVHDMAATLEELSADLLPHLLKEERVLFPLAIELLGAVEPTGLHGGSVTNPIRAGAVRGVCGDGSGCAPARAPREQFAVPEDHRLGDVARLTDLHSLAGGRRQLDQCGNYSFLHESGVDIVCKVHSIGPAGGAEHVVLGQPAGQIDLLDRE